VVQARSHLCYDVVAWCSMVQHMRQRQLGGEGAALCGVASHELQRVLAGQVGGEGGGIHDTAACSWMGCDSKAHAACMHDE